MTAVPSLMRVVTDATYASHINGSGRTNSASPPGMRPVGE